MISLRLLLVAIAPTQQAPTFTAGELLYILICVQRAYNSKMSTTYGNLINKSHLQLHIKQHQRKTTATVSINKSPENQS